VTFDRAALRELFDYTTFTWSAYADAMRGVSQEDFARAVDGSGWPSLRQALFHIAAAWDGWICTQSGSGETIDESYRPETWAELQAYRNRMRPLLLRIIDEMPDEQFDAPLPGVAGGPGRPPREVVAHILLHERGHHGDISTLLSALGVPPPKVDYLVFVFSRISKP
jgi:uncharacterized damage-inducible protein DinB